MMKRRTITLEFFVPSRLPGFGRIVEPYNGNRGRHDAEKDKQDTLERK